MKTLKQMALLGVMMITIYACTTGISGNITSLLGVEAETAATPDVFTLDLTIPAVPETTGLPFVLGDSNKYAWDIFAWQTFIAMNWPAIQPSSDNGYLRGYPDMNKNFKDAGSYQNTALVWETFKEKREMFINGATTMEAAKPKPWSSDYAYGAEGRAPIGAHAKRVFGTGKFATLDETVQVQAEARESYYDVGHPKSTDEVRKGQVTVARVFRGIPDIGSDSTPGNAVRYEVKVNYDFYKYVVDNGLYYDKKTYARSKKRPPVQLPWRTTLPDPGVSFYTQKPAETSYVEGYTIAGALDAYRLGAQQKNGTPPPRIGAIHVKAAWAPISTSDTSRFLWREAEYFSGTTKTAETSLFGLVGLHIIQRIKPSAPQDALNNNPLGGTFIYSTWEHRDIRQNAADTTYNGNPTTQYTYTNYFGGGGILPLVISPPLDSPFYVSRLYPILPHTRTANKKFQELVGSGSVWSNYRLVGTQFKPVNITTDAPVTGGGQSATDPFVADTVKNPNNVNYEPVYLANLVIETNVGLQQFQGQPPLLEPVPQFSVVTAPNPNMFVRVDNTTSGTPPQPVFGNLAYGNVPHNMGGCMGCHGVAQLNGYSFSFVLLGGQAGADPDSEVAFLDPLGTRNTIPKPVHILRSDMPINGITSTNFGGYIANKSNVAQRQATEVALTLIAADGRVKGSPFNFGDGVYITDGNGNYLTASNDASATGSTKKVSFTSTKSSAGVWYLYKPSDPASSSDVLETDSISFRNAAISFGTSPAYLSSASGTLPVDLNTTSTAGTGSSSYQLWNLELPQ